MKARIVWKGADEEQLIVWKGAYEVEDSVEMGR